MREKKFRGELNFNGKKNQLKKYKISLKKFENSNPIMYSKYCREWEIKDTFFPEYICIFNGWVEEKYSYLMDEVTTKEWERFDSLVRLLAKDYKLYLINHNKKTCSLITNIENIIVSYEISMNKDATQFTEIIIPELNAVLSESWDYTYILWHKKNGAKEKVNPLVTNSKLYQFTKKNLNCK